MPQVCWRLSHLCSVCSLCVTKSHMSSPDIVLSAREHLTSRPPKVCPARPITAFCASMVGHTTVTPLTVGCTVRISIPVASSTKCLSCKGDLGGMLVILTNHFPLPLFASSLMISFCHRLGRPLRRSWYSSFGVLSSTLSLFSWNYLRNSNHCC